MAESSRMDFSEIGTTGLKRSGGYVQEEFLKELTGARGARVYREMASNHPIIGASLLFINLLVRQVEWNVVPFAEDDAGDAERAEFLKGTLFEDMSVSWGSVLSEVMSMLPYGWCLLEIVYKVRGGLETDDATRKSRFADGKIGVRKLSIRAQESLARWVFDEEGGTQAMVQQSPLDFNEHTIPLEKSLLFRLSANKGSPEGRSILRHAYVPWYFQKNIMNIEGIGIERDLAGLPVAWVPPSMLDPNADETTKAHLVAMKRLVTNIKRDEQEGVIFPLHYDANGNKVYDFTLLTSGGRRQFDTDAIVQRYDMRIAIALLTDFMLLGTGRTGSFALSADKTDMFSIALSAFLDEIGETVNRYLVPRLWKLNGFPVDRLTKIEHGRVSKINLQEIGDFISKLSASGYPFLWDQKLKIWVADKAGFPPPPEDEEALVVEDDEVEDIAPKEKVKHAH